MTKIILKNSTQEVMKKIFLGYSESSTAFRIYNKRTCVIMESVNVVFDDHSYSKGIEGSIESNDEQDKSKKARRR